MAGRPCTICTDNRLSMLDAEILEGANSIAWIARKYAVSEDALYRHADRHVERILLSTIRERQLITIAEFADRLIESADQARAARDRAATMNNSAAFARLADAEAKILRILMDRLGITNTSGVEEFRQAEQLIRAFFDASVEHPEIGEWVAAELEKRSHREFAESIRETTQAARQRRIDHAQKAVSR